METPRSADSMARLRSLGACGGVQGVPAIPLGGTQLGHPLYGWCCLKSRVYISFAKYPDSIGHTAGAFLPRVSSHHQQMHKLLWTTWPSPHLIINSSIVICYKRIMGKFSTSTRKQNYSSYRAFRRKLSFGFFCLFFWEPLWVQWCPVKLFKNLISYKAFYQASKSKLGEKKISLP